jgi:hypothetical protein
MDTINQLEKLWAESESFDKEAVAKILAEHEKEFKDFCNGLFVSVQKFWPVINNSTKDMMLKFIEEGQKFSLEHKNKHRKEVIGQVLAVVRTLENTETVAAEIEKML